MWTHGAGDAVVTWWVLKPGFGPHLGPRVERWAPCHPRAMRSQFGKVVACPRTPEGTLSCPLLPHLWPLCSQIWNLGACFIYLFVF